MSLSRIAGKQWLWLCGLLGGAVVLGGGCGAPDAEVEPQPSVEQARPLVQCTPSSTGLTACGVVTTATGAPVAGAMVDLRGIGTLTAADGSFSVSAPAPMGSALTITAPGYMPHVGAITRNVLGARFVLHTLHRQTFTGGTPTVADPRSGASIQVNLSALQGPSGEQPLPPFTVGVRYIDTGLLAMPGADAAINRAGQTVFLESRGAIYTEVRDAKGTLLKLRAGATARIFIPLTNDMAGSAPSSIALWSMGVGTNVWNQQATPATRAPNPTQCGVRETVTCDPDDCSRISSTGFGGNTSEIGFVNADIEKTNPACLRVVVNAASLPPGTVLPICLELEIPIPTGGTQTRNMCVGAGTDVLYNLPANVNVTVRQASGFGCPPPPSGSVTVNTGAPWGGAGVPASPGQCNGVLTLPPLP
ncbi:carboxypeptidase regulatory-like domain-containing protein [Myxococcus llanfairpwllgwyngyllgogerychwyrndrobwllllantysiliogogogochensis]|uniref:Carboxypeptidase regulatory-like domain-containing protein n=1 Tax=Myxococcus llanfairpwllgwyngyllgogerychwyrndrobwllllantysiliogogogochensis TaxID=2590453 RepID=A0A540X725_9BACT|nr:carboxypeptidase-like regulatory domain-containing protein [Myxococcus llanfairpwllgwyngyllgogerychwyrndrobwllllantysiliogogogochensis]TQF17081.1 carboxypeptidase regulatory-like domain-containing protein [Myxococcus llanfairpwllgwyngyllgogerychwyrndrobwllllantysiliogogogochensis]